MVIDKSLKLPYTTTMNEILNTPNQIRAFHIASQIKAIKLEGTGLKFRGGSILAHCKKHYMLKGNRAKVMEEMEKIKAHVLEGN